MSVSDADIAFACELFADLGAITTRKMMGGATIYCDGQVFAMLDGEGTPYVKAKGAMADKLADAGSSAFVFTDKSGKSSTMGYWMLPDEARDDPDAACDWARQVLAAL